MRADLTLHLRDRGFEVDEIGPAEGGRSDYPDQALVVAQAVSNGEARLGVLVCGTGIGMSIAANKVPGVRAALVHDTQTAELAAMHNDANILCLGGRLMEPEVARQLVDIWLDTSFEARHQPRLDKIKTIEHAQL